MLDKLFAFIRSGVKNAILNGIDDAGEVIAGRIGIDGEPKLIEAKSEPKPKTNGRSRRTATAK